MFFTKRCPSGGTEYVSFELCLGILRGPGEGRGGAPGTVPLQNPEVTSRKACLRNADWTESPALLKWGFREESSSKAAPRVGFLRDIPQETYHWHTCYYQIHVFEIS